MSRFLPIGEAARITCTKCGWTQRVEKPTAYQAIIDHRDLRCPYRLQGAPNPPKRDRHLKTGSRPKPPRSQRCPTCRDTLVRINDAITCAQGCTNEAQV